MKYLITILMSLFLINCANKTSTVEPMAIVVFEDLPAPAKEEPTPIQNWVYDPEPWIETPDTIKPDIVSIGDSISGGYIAALTRNMLETHDVKHPNDNCRNSHYTLSKIDQWIADYPQADIFVWNNGVWDSAWMWWYEAYADKTINQREWYDTPLDQYESNIIAIARKLKATGKRVIFVTTTHILGPPFKIGNELVLNEIAKRVLPSEGIEIVDIYPISASTPNAHPNPWDVHFTREVNQKLADIISDFIKTSF